MHKFNKDDRVFVSDPGWGTRRMDVHLHDDAIVVTVGRE